MMAHCFLVIPECFYRESTFQNKMDSRLEHAGMTWYGGFYTLSDLWLGLTEWVVLTQLLL